MKSIEDQSGAGIVGDNVAHTESSSEYIVAIYPMGLMPAFFISSKTIEKVKDAENEKDRSKNNKPPKPPRRPNARIGRVALGGGF